MHNKEYHIPRKNVFSTYFFCMFLRNVYIFAGCPCSRLHLVEMHVPVVGIAWRLRGLAIVCSVKKIGDKKSLILVFLTIVFVSRVLPCVDW